MTGGIYDDHGFGDLWVWNMFVLGVLCGIVRIDMGWRVCLRIFTENAEKLFLGGGA